jgi:hypothetical protein
MGCAGVGWALSWTLGSVGLGRPSDGLDVGLGTLLGAGLGAGLGCPWHWAGLGAALG